MKKIHNVLFITVRFVHNSIYSYFFFLKFILIRLNVQKQTLSIKISYGKKLFLKKANQINKSYPFGESYFSLTSLLFYPKMANLDVLHSSFLEVAAVSVGKKLAPVVVPVSR